MQITTSNQQIHTTIFKDIGDLLLKPDHTLQKQHDNTVASTNV